MCGRFEGVNETWNELHELLSGFAQLPRDIAIEVYADRELRPTNKYPIMTRTTDGGVRIVEARWWLVPGFFKGALKDWKATTFNAKIEEAAEKPTFRSAWKSRHCLVPVASFWEWKLLNPEAPKAKQEKQRYCIRRGDNHPMVLAGLWEQVTTDEGPLTSFTILTRAPGPDMAFLHNREPVVLGPDQWAPWLECKAMPELSAPSQKDELRYSPETRIYA